MSSVSSRTTRPRTEQELREYIQKHSVTSKELEKELLEALSRKDETKASRKRIPLCESLSDWILTHPPSALEADAMHRLWRHCFYSRVGALRSLIAKEQRKGWDVRKTQELLSLTLAEGMTMYDYMIGRLTSRLTGEEDSQYSASTVWSEHMTEAIVPVIYELYISLGDLYRYGEKISRAEDAYAKASQLGPGRGHAYNQMAVVCQMQDLAGAAPLSAVAFYWYSRALGATGGIFETALNNLTRLLRDNRTWLLQQDQVVQSSDQKSTSRLFLAGFLDLQYTFLMGASTQVKETIQAVDRTLASLESLLKTSSLGDSLLIKLVTIAAFCQDKRHLVTHDKTMCLTTTALSRILLLRMGEHLGQRWLVSHEKSSSSVRGLGPLSLLLDYLILKSPVVPTACENLYQAALDSFGEVLVQVLNRVVEAAAKRMGPPLTDTMPREYMALIGFEPFGFLPHKNFMSAEEAGTLLSPNGTTQPSQESSISGASSQEGGRLKVAHLLEIGQRLAKEDAGDLAKHVTLHEDQYAWSIQQHDDEDEDQDMVVEDDVDLPQGEEEEDSDKTQAPEDVLVYQPNRGGGPALLVPGALLQAVSPVAAPALPPKKRQPMFEPTPPSEPQGQQDMILDTFLPLPLQTSNGLDNSTAPMEESPPRPAVLMPPPGFGPPAAAAPVNMPTAVNSTLDPMLPPGLNAMATVGDSLHLFGGGAAMQTANPFAIPTTAAATTTFAPPQAASFEGLFRQEDVHGMDGASFLDSSLLKSLMAEDTPQKTKNPFAT